MGPHSVCVHRVQQSQSVRLGPSEQREFRVELATDEVFRRDRISIVKLSGKNDSIVIGHYLNRYRARFLDCADRKQAAAWRGVITTILTTGANGAFVKATSDPQSTVGDCFINSLRDIRLPRAKDGAPVVATFSIAISK